jgi:GH24 family phage-related lysozyme (muramidase)
MFKSILFAGLVLLSVHSTSVADPSSEGNYDDLQVFLKGFMSTYAGSSYIMSGCLSESSQSSLDRELASTYLYLLSGQLSEMMQAYESFLTLLSESCNECGLSSVSSSLRAGISQKGKIWYEINLLYNSKKIESSFETFFTQLKAKNWAGAGSSLGQITAVLVPYTKNVSLNALDMNTPAYQAWWKGLVSTLSLNPKKQGICAAFFLNLGNQTIQVATDFDKLNNGDLSGINTLFGDLANLLTWWQGKYTNDFCNFDMLEVALKSLKTKDGITQLFMRYFARAININSAYLAVAECSSNTYSCGQGVGTIFKYLIGWSIN